MGGAFVKDTAGFIALPGALETPFHEQDGLLTPNDRFFVCNTAPTPVLDAGRWSLSVEGDAVARPLRLSLADLEAMETVELDAVLECAGNQRKLFETVMGETLDRRPEVTELLWTLGGVGMARWRGARLTDVLDRAGIAEDAFHVLPVGADVTEEEPKGACIPLSAAKARHPDTLIALSMNGEPLPHDHGFPARLIVPGWVGTYSVKWLTRIEVTRARRWVSRNTKRYVMMGEAWAGGDWGPARGPQVTKHPVRSSLALPWPARLAPGRRRLTGYARGAEEAIVRVVWSADGGRSWADAELLSPSVRYAWVRFAFDWDATPGEHALTTRATDAKGETQPMSQPFNHGGYLFHMAHPHPVTVA